MVLFMLRSEKYNCNDIGRKQEQLGDGGFVEPET